MVTVLIIGLGVAMKKPNILLVLVKVQVEQQIIHYILNLLTKDLNLIGI
ncbi:MAG: hypothetical protein SO083_01855 [Megamonas funiformis]|nr:hypothetical protein [Megamonas funiformis]MDY3873894.1 hypothetical protein [Megamonas funiformis]